MLSGVHCSLTGDQMTMTGTDLDLTISVEFPVAGEEDGVVVVPSKLIVDVIKSLEPGAVTLESSGDSVRISGGRSHFSLRLIPAEEFPHLSETSADSVTLDVAAFAEGLSQVVPAASTDDSRPILTGVLLAAEGNGLRLVATDSYRLAVRDLPGTAVLDADQSVLIPSRALEEVRRLLSGASTLTVQFGEGSASFEIDDVRLTTRLIDGDFPAYRGLIPQSQPNRLTVDRAALIESVRRVKLMAREPASVRLTLTESGVTLAAVTQDVGEASEDLEGTFEGSELTVAFNPEFLLNGLEVTPGEEVSLYTTDELKPALLRPTDSDDVLYLLMPVRVS